jgi:hypothetical protein
MSVLKAPQRTLLLTSLTQYYQQHPEYAHKLKEILNGLSPVSLRIIDWFVTHYAKKQNVNYWLTNDKKNYFTILPSQSDMFKFYLYVDYRAQLKSYTKLLFDPFRRHERISFIIQSKPLEVIETTVGQLNFFRWAFENHVIDYMIDKIDIIEQDMAQFMIQRKDIPKALDKKIKPVPDKTRSRKGIPMIQTNHNVHLTW